MAFNYKCDQCGEQCLTNSKYTKGDKTFCPICVLGEEGKQSKYWETSQAKNAGHPEGFRYLDDTATYKYHWDSDLKKWVDKDGNKKGVDKDGNKKGVDVGV